MRRAGRIAAAAVVFSLAMLAAGWALGPIRVLLVEPRLGQTLAVWLEAPIMLAVILLSARWVSRRFALTADPPGRLSVGAMAFILVFLAEIVGGRLLRGRDLAQTLSGLISPAGLPMLGLYLAVLLGPWRLGGRLERDQGAGD